MKHDGQKPFDKKASNDGFCYLFQKHKCPKKTGCSREHICIWCSSSNPFSTSLRFLHSLSVWTCCSHGSCRFFLDCWLDDLAKLRDYPQSLAEELQKELAGGSGTFGSSEGSLGCHFVFDARVEGFLFLFLEVCLMAMVWWWMPFVFSRYLWLSILWLRVWCVCVESGVSLNLGPW